MRRRPTAAGALAAALLLSPVGDDTVLRAVGGAAAAAVWRQLVLDLAEFALVRRALLRVPSCRYWLRRLANEAGVPDASQRAAIPDDDRIWPIWYWLAGEIRAEECTGR